MSHHEAQRYATAPGPAGSPHPPPRLEAAGICKRYRRSAVLQDVNLTVYGGQVAAVIGANGTGKSTFLKICAGMISPDRGTVSIRGSVGYCPQQPSLLQFLRPDEHFELFGAAAGAGRDPSRRAGRSLAGALSWDPAVRTQARHLSGGTQQKLNLVLSAIGDPDLILLDEPYQGFDHGSYVDFWEWVFRWRSQGRAVVVVTHMLNSLDRVDTVLDLTHAQTGAGIR
ncbi:ABC transporter ATP-binding protein [Dactylosporangium sp. NPDC051484]|uniref:ABC transporter ATP-binding protein n=1 Tax=Dactylosporangium sp. NPDC051484 TaxID=3154942 RepID=UPI00344CFE4B